MGGPPKTAQQNSSLRKHTHTARTRTLTNTIKQPTPIKRVCGDLVKTVSKTVSQAGLGHLQRQQLGTQESKHHSLDTHTHTLASHYFICVAAMIALRNLRTGAPRGEEASVWVWVFRDIRSLRVLLPPLFEAFLGRVNAALFDFLCLSWRRPQCGDTDP